MYFRNEYAFLSNMYECSIKFNGITYRNVEACFQAQKDLSRSKEFSNLDGYTAKRLGRRVKLRSDWQQIKVDLMFRIIYEKFRSNKELQYKLVATGDIELVEDNTWNDTFWGRCDGVGENMLGKILMDVRDMFNPDPSDKRNLKQMNSNSNIQSEVNKMKKNKLQTQIFVVGKCRPKQEVRVVKGKTFTINNINAKDVLTGLSGNEFTKTKNRYIFNTDATEFYFSSKQWNPDVADYTDYILHEPDEPYKDIVDVVYQQYLYNKKCIQLAQMNTKCAVYIDDKKVWTSRQPVYLLEAYLKDRNITAQNNLITNKHYYTFNEKDCRQVREMYNACVKAGISKALLKKPIEYIIEFVDEYADMYEVSVNKTKLKTIKDTFRNIGAGHNAVWTVNKNQIVDYDMSLNNDFVIAYYHILYLQHYGFEPDHTKYARCPHCGSWYSLSAPHRPGRCRNCETIETREDFMDSIVEFDVEFRDWLYDANDYDNEDFMDNATEFDVEFRNWLYDTDDGDADDYDSEF